MMSSFKTWECQICNWVYDEAMGCPEEGIKPGTRWEDIPDNWSCPECGVGKTDFDMQAIAETDDNMPMETIQPPATGASIRDLIVIIGTGLAGYGLAKSLRETSQSRPIYLITSDNGTYYAKPSLSNGFSAKKSANAMAKASAEDMARQFDLTVFTHTAVERVDTSENRVVLKSGADINYGKLVLANGSRPVVPSICGIELPGVVNVNSLDDYARLRTLLKPNGSILIIGAGLIGSEFANDLTCSGFRVSIVDSNAGFMSSKIGDEVSSIVTQAIASEGVECFFNQSVDSITREYNQLSAHLSSGISLTVDVILTAVGISPNLTLAKSAGLNCNRGIVVNEWMQTSHQDVFALGDCVEFNEQVRPFVGALNKQVTSLTATLNGRQAPLDYGVMPVSVKTQSHPLVFYHPENVEGHWQIDAKSHSGVKARFVDKLGRQVGFVVTGSFISQAKSYQAACQVEW